MSKKLFILVLISVIFLNPLYSILTDINLVQPLIIKLNESKKFKTHLLCFSEKGFVIWNSTYYFNKNDILKYAEYHSFEELEYFQLKGKLNLYPLVIGSTLAGIAFLSVDEDSELGDALVKIAVMIIAGFGGILFSFTSMIFPRRTNPIDDNSIDDFPKKYFTFPGKIPEELIEFIGIYEE